MAENDKKTFDPIPEEFETFEELSEFWDAHDLADYEDYLTPMSFEVASQPTYEYVIVLSDSLNKIMHEAQKQERVSVGTLINLWIQEKLQTYQAAS